MEFLFLDVYSIEWWRNYKLEDIAVEVKNISKKFRIYHEKRNSIFETISGLFNKKKHYEDINIFKNLSFSIKKGEMFGILGNNGAGKTTLLRIISGIYQPNSGTIKINGSLVPLLALGSGFNMELTAKANVIEYGILLGLKKNDIANLVNEIMRFAELEKFEDVKLKNFSSGMYARLAFATAIQINPDIIIIDEVLQVGDLGFQRKSFEAIQNFHKKGKTIIFVTHNITPIKNYCDRAMFLNKGTIEMIGDPIKVAEAYENSS